MARIGDSRLIFGVDDESFGYMSAKAVDKATNKVEAPDGNGDTVAVEYNNLQYTVTGTFTYFTGESSPYDEVGSGTAVTITDVGQVYIESATTNWTSGDWSEIAFTGMIYPNLYVAP